MACRIQTIELREFPDRVLGIMAASCFIIGIALFCGIIYSLVPSVCNYPKMTGEKQHAVSLFGIYHLTEVDAHYKEYLLAMDIPQTVAEIITKMSETLVIKPSASRKNGLIMSTITKWATRETEIMFDSQFNVSYGSGDQDRGVLHSFCTRPGVNIIQCRTDDPSRGWSFEYSFVFSSNGLVTKRLFLNKNIKTSKKYRRDPLGLP